MSTSKRADRLWPNGHTRSGHSFLCWKCRKMQPQSGEIIAASLSFISFCFFCLLPVVSASFPSQSFHMSKVLRVRPAPCFCQMLVWGGFRPPPLSLFLALPSLRLFWQALLEFSPHGSGRKSMPICVFSCSSLYWWRLEQRKKDRWVKSRDCTIHSTDYGWNIHKTLHLFTDIMDE